MLILPLCFSHMQCICKGMLVVFASTHKVSVLWFTSHAVASRHLRVLRVPQASCLLDKKDKCSMIQGRVLLGPFCAI
jgi:hypothetical protein